MGKKLMMGFWAPAPCGGDINKMLARFIACFYWSVWLFD
jgi:hypothetical protein